MPIKRRLVQPPGNGTAAGLPVGGDFYERYPNLWEFLSEDHFEDGSPRVTGTLNLFTDAGKAKCCLKDRDQAMFAFVTSATFDGLLDAVEDGLYNGHLDWRRDQPPKGRKT